MAVFPNGSSSTPLTGKLTKPNTRWRHTLSSEKDKNRCKGKNIPSFLIVVLDRGKFNNDFLLSFENVTLKI
jgi:hypothetical protein